ncbi:MAG: hypothetical protein EXX96DRAFT_611629 [Benjaminiella poitrasii]|nr:MAG: hypothetical protein EXX96DRAFT_611629 [Benjaminiella poitrasii]
MADTMDEFRSSIQSYMSAQMASHSARLSSLAEIRTSISTESPTPTYIRSTSSISRTSTSSSVVSLPTPTRDLDDRVSEGVKNFFKSPLGIAIIVVAVVSFITAIVFYAFIFKFLKRVRTSLRVSFRRN